MKKMFVLWLLVFASTFAFGKVASSALSWIDYLYPTVHMVAPSKYYFSPGDDVYVKLIAGNNANLIVYVDLFLGKEFIGRDDSSPFEWCKPTSSDHEQLRNMATGVYSVSAVVKYIDGKKKIITRKFEVKSPYTAVNQFMWLMKIIQAHPNWNIIEYRFGDQSYFKMHSCSNSSSTVYWYDQQGQIVDRQNSRTKIAARFAGARLIKSWQNPCS